MALFRQKIKSRWKKIQLVSASILVLWLGTTLLVLNKTSTTSSEPDQYDLDTTQYFLNKKQSHLHQTQQMQNTIQADVDSLVIQPHHLNFGEHENSSSASYLPAALHPIPSNSTILESCCQMASSPFKTNRIACQGVCHTPQACVEGGMYPFRNEEEKNFFTLRNETTDKLRALKSKCDQRSSLLKPPYQWCRQWMGEGGGINHERNKFLVTDYISSELNHTLLYQYNHKHIDPYNANLPPPGCSILSEGGGSGSYQNLILFPSAKLAVCGILKSGSTQWVQFLRFTLGARDYHSRPHEKPEFRFFRFDKLTEEMQRQILNDPEWKFAAFIRNPEERLLSAYLDKVNPKNDPQFRQHFQKNFDFSKPPSFEEFVLSIAKKRTVCPFTKTKPPMRERLWGVDWCTDPHWRPQTFSCGLSEFLPRFSYIGTLDKVEHQSRSLLKEVGLWDTFGKYYHWTADKKSIKGAPCWVFPPTLNVGDKLYGFQQRPSNPQSDAKSKEAPASIDSKNGTSNVVVSASDTAYGHAKGSQSKIKQYYTPRLLQIVKDLYHNDYELYSLIQNSDDLESGSVLAMKISGQCRKRAFDLSKTS